MDDLQRRIHPSLPLTKLAVFTSISWAHPEFGQLLATSGSDRFATIWEERAEINMAGGFNVNHANVPSAGSASIVVQVVIAIVLVIQMQLRETYLSLFDGSHNL